MRPWASPLSSVSRSWLVCKMTTVTVLTSQSSDEDSQKIMHLKSIVLSLAHSKPPMSVSCHSNCSWDATPFVILLCPPAQHYEFGKGRRCYSSRYAPCPAHGRRLTKDGWMDGWMDERRSCQATSAPLESLPLAKWQAGFSFSAPGD